MSIRDFPNYSDDTSDMDDIEEDDFDEDLTDEAVNNLEKMLQKLFGHPGFRTKEQKEAVQTMLKGKQDLVCLMPTGSGKSLVYQLPAVIKSKKVTVVICPLLALVQDQINQLALKEIVAKTIHSKMSENEKKSVIKDCANKHPSLRLLYVTPEMAASASFNNLIETMMAQNTLACFVVDEAHVLTSWGNTFRPDYLKLGELRLKTGSVPWAALTATATPSCAKKIATTLNLKNGFKTIKLPSYRDNLYYDVVTKDVEDKDTLDNLLAFLFDKLGEENDCAIVYCRKKVATEKLANELTSRGLLSKAYHAGL